ncbi:MAG: hypothetical protein QOG57_4848, partial [Pseudonocardiales bacterium]|nr:hypothetical protein [Pseudonocardiales bacterium]
TLRPNVDRAIAAPVPLSPILDRYSACSAVQNITNIVD